jgi:hypothetical protein
MFDQMVSDLRNGILPANNLLRKRFDAAMVKKLGVIRTPYSFWPADRKINPPAKELLWAAILLDDLENFRVVEAVITSELEEKQKTKGFPEDLYSLAGKTNQLIHEYIREFLGLAPTETLREKLEHKSRQFLHPV